MPYKDKQKGREYSNEYRKRKRMERGLQKQGRKSLSLEEKEISKKKRRERESLWAKKYFEHNPQKRLLWAAKRRAKVKGLDFNLTEEDIYIPEYCPYLGIKLETHAPRGSEKRSVISLDRVDPAKGYTKDNVEVISWQANVMKSDCDVQLQIKFAKEVLRRYEGINF